MLQQLLTTAVFNSTGLTMAYGDKGWQNMLADQVLGRWVYHMRPVKFRIDDQQLVSMNETYPTIILFLQKTQLDYTPAQQATATLGPRQDLRDFVSYCRDADEIKSITGVEAIEVYNILDANLSGWMLYCNIEPYATDPAC